MEIQSESQLQGIFQIIGQAANEDELRSQVTHKIRKYFTTTRSGIFFFDSLLSANIKLPSALKKAAETALSTERNPIARYIAERHAPAHESLVSSPKAWQLVCPRPDHWHVMAGPIVTKGQLIGVLGCTREKSQSAFTHQDLADMSAVCMHLSTWATAMRIQQSSDSLENSLNGNTTPLAARLTARERQIADLVALGKKNAEVGAELWITENSVKQALKKIFRKLEVSSRTEMAVQLSAEKQPR